MRSHIASQTRPDDGRQTLGIFALHLVCCGGAALLLLLSGAGLTGIGIVQGSFWLLIIGFVVVAVGLAWRARRRRLGAGPHHDR